MEKKNKSHSRGSSVSSRGSNRSAAGHPSVPQPKPQQIIQGRNESEGLFKAYKPEEVPRPRGSQETTRPTTTSVAQSILTPADSNKDPSGKGMTASKRRNMVLPLMIFTGTITSAVLLVLFIIFSRKPNSGVLRQPRPVSSTKMGSYREWVAVTGNEECQGVPRKILEKNGTIGDMAVATALCTCVVMPHRCSLGGGFFAIYYDREKKTAHAINCRSRAPKSANVEMYRESDSSLRDGMAVGVFGELRGYQKILNTTGSRVPWAELFEDAIQYADNGFSVYGDLEKYIRELYTFYMQDNDIREVLVNSTTDKPLALGERLINKKLADMLRNVSVSGPDTLSVGYFAELLAQEIKDKGGIIDHTDFEDFQAVLEPALQAEFSDKSTIYGVPLPSGGTLVAYIMGIVDKLRSSSGMLQDDEKTWHHIVEAFKFGFGKRPYFRDPAALDVSKDLGIALGNLVKSLLSRNVTRFVSKKIRGQPQADVSFYGMDMSKIQDHGSGQLCIFAPNGDAFAMTTSINTEFGALFRSHQTGIWLNNVMNDFSSPYSDNVYGLPPAVPNYIVPGKRPMSSLAPSIVVDANGDVILAITSTGSATITTGIAQVMIRILWMNHSVKEAIDCGRLHNQLYPDELRYEDTLDKDVVAGLQWRGHHMVLAPWEGNVVAVARDPRTNRFNGSYDYRHQSSGGVDGD
ncbi:scoloptoxin SSD14-like [Ornithodoros turicata]|uniref:scoloptoxin SSD14-like n=1 Tax=Ornithodoros turicata TaxID=34597 RepID=UPI00313983D9